MTTIDLSQLPKPDVVEILDFDTLLASRKNALIAACPAEIQDAVAQTLALPSEPLTKLLEENAYYDLLLRRRINEAALANMVAFAQGADLDHLAANNNVKRLRLSEGDATAIPPVLPVFESDNDLRLRIPAAFEGLSVAGPTGSYEFYARSADGRVADASVISPKPAEVTVTILSREGNGTTSQTLINTVEKALNDENVRPVADRVMVQSADILSYQVDASLYLLPAPEYEPILQTAREKLTAYTREQHRLGRDVALSALYAALHVTGVTRVVIHTPKQDIKITKTQASFCTDINLKMESRTDA
ncbi:MULTISPECIES: baseplate J/gp47 family protein [unclassified Arsenophonus]|uniref:baseplate assembly protein n=1 Tax=unclassified Arsenophonus TaxID=2627083 RepID=UPI00285F9466|nr:baseplate J/gp47 family protein [Arsenophonus sp.]MDR5610876.1 baseplate J/gp47 family protein [Arsenophonus sp.]MDR5614712.1 baseplate J/gp47 family protein [Arsenophonus sp.]